VSFKTLISVRYTDNIAAFFIAGFGAEATGPVSAFSECVYTLQLPIVRRRILSETSYNDFISQTNP
jgi:hypothetical protein